MPVVACNLRDVGRARVFGVLVLRMIVCVRVDRPVGMTVFVLVFGVLAPDVPSGWDCDPLGYEPLLEVRNVVGSERIVQGAHVGGILGEFTGDDALLERAPVNRHVPFAQSQTAVDELNEELARRTFRVAFEPLGEP